METLFHYVIVLHASMLVLGLVFPIGNPINNLSAILPKIMECPL